MKKLKILCSLAVLATLIMTSGGAGGIRVYADEAKVQQEEVPVIEAGKLKAAQNTDQLIVVAGQGGYKVQVSYHAKDDKGEWNQVFTTPGVYGKNGSTAEKKEGDGKTPVGTYQFSTAFGLKDNPGSVLSYHKVTAYDYWVDDSSSKYYNRLVDSRYVKKDWKSAEKLSSGAPFYNYALALNYNSDCVPRKGSAIYLHCTKSSADTGSAGCIRIPEEQMITLVKAVDSTTNIVIVSDISQLEYQ